MRNRTIVLFAALIAIGAAVVGFRETAGGVTAAHEYNHIIGAVVDGRTQAESGPLRTPGHPDAFGTFSAVISPTRLCYGFQVIGLSDPRAAHLHRVADEAGSVLRLRGMEVGSRCRSIPDDLSRALRRHPGRFYVDIHTRGFPNGAVRGRLAHPERN